MNATPEDEVVEEVEESRFPIYPTLMTLGNAICGLAAIGLATKSVVSSDAVAEGTTLMMGVAEAQSLQYAGVLIFLGILFDTLDGQVARWTNQTSRFGMHLDSLCDVITFGVAPAFIMLAFSDTLHPRFIRGIAGIYTLCAILRLARYNVQAETESGVGSYFRGLPSPAAAGTIATFAMAMPDIIVLLNSLESHDKSLGQVLYALFMIVVPLLTVVLACLMVSRVPYPHIGKHLANREKSRKNFVKLVQILFAVIVILIFKELALPMIFVYYVTAPPCVVTWKNLVKRRPAAENVEADSS